MDIRTIRTNLQLSQDEFGRRVGVTGRTVARWESMRFKPSEAALRLMESFLGPRTLEALPRDVYYRYKRAQGAARTAVDVAVKRGQLQRLSEVVVPCVDCGQRATSYDHRDYFDPLTVDAVCHSCNAKRGVAIPTLSKVWTGYPDKTLALLQHLCLRCSYNWGSKVVPKACPNCRSKHWNKEQHD